MGKEFGVQRGRRGIKSQEKECGEQRKRRREKKSPCHTRENKVLIQAQTTTVDVKVG